MSEPIYVGNSHANGGIPAVNVDTGERLEIEGDEMKICRDAYNSSEVLEYIQKTNREVVTDIHQNFSCKFDQSKVNSGDFILCKLVVLDDKKHDRRGTVKDILNQMQSEHSCRISEHSPQAQMERGGQVEDDVYEYLYLLLGVKF
jgi:hypothetical protein